jgi:hypothetical protein
MCEMTLARMTPRGEWFPSTDELSAFTGCVEAKLEGRQQMRGKGDAAQARPDPVEKGFLEPEGRKTPQTLIQMLVHPSDFVRREIPVEIVVQSGQNLLTRHLPPPFA